MMRHVILLALTLLPAMAAAQSVRVQSGDHPTFTRLAILFRDIPDWSLGRVEGGYELRTVSDNGDYDLGQVYRRIGRDRIAALEPRGEGRLFLAVTCDCHADAFEIPAGLVLDIRDGEPGSDSRFEAALPPLAGEAPALETAATPPLAILGPLRSVPLRTPYAWQDELALDLTPPTALPDTGAEPDAPDLAERLDRMQEDLLAQISRAAGQGMIETDQSQIDAALAAARAEPEPDPVPAPAAAPDPKPEPPEPPADDDPMAALNALENVSIETAVDRGQTGRPRTRPMTVDGIACVADDRLDIGSWGEPLEGGAELGTYRGQILGEFDAADPESIAALARNYVYMTFGLEARVLIDAFEAEVPEAAVYLALADIMDDGEARTPNPFADQLTCPNRAALWAVLSRPKLRPGDKVAAAHVVAAFSELPLHLRRHLGPWLVERFVALGDTDTANSLRNAVARAPGDHGDDLHLMDAEIALEAGDVDEGNAHLETVVGGDGAMAASALVRLIDSQIAAGKGVAPRDRDNAAALAFANRGTPLGADLKRVQIRALAHGGDIEGALAELAAYEEALEPDVVTALRVEIYGLTVEAAPDERFLKTVLPGPVPLGDSVEGDNVRREIAARLIGLGLTEPARILLSDDLSIPTEPDRLLYAQAYLREGRPELVIGYLAGLGSEAAKRLRAEAHEMAAEYRRAAATYADVDDAEARARAVWRGQDWAEAADVTTGVQREAASLASEPPPGPRPGPGAGQLAASRRLIEQSRETRRILEELLRSEAAPES